MWRAKGSTACEPYLDLDVKKQHDITDYLGYPPNICSSHKMVESMFCQTCHASLCDSCLRLHSGHIFVSQEEKASEIRAKIFEIITSFENNEKPLRKQKQVCNDFLEDRKKENEAKRQFVDSCIEKVKNDIYAKLSEEPCDNAPVFSEAIEKLHDEITDVESQVNPLHETLRGLLSLSRTQLIKKFPTVETNCNDVLSKQTKYVEKNVPKFGSKFKLDHVNDDMVQVFVQDLSESFMRLIGHCRNDLEEVIHVKCREDFDISKLSSLDRGRLYRSPFSSNSFLFEEIDDKTNKTDFVTVTRLGEDLVQFSSEKMDGCDASQPQSPNMEKSPIDQTSYCDMLGTES